MLRALRSALVLFAVLTGLASPALAGERAAEAGIPVSQTVAAPPALARDRARPFALAASDAFSREIARHPEWSGFTAETGGQYSLFGGPKPTILTDFTHISALPSSLYSYTGANGTYVNSAGVITAAATNAPRFDYSPTSIGTPLGLLIEEPRTNATFPSASLVSGWSFASLAGASAQGIAPDGTNSYFTLTDNSTNTLHLSYNNQTLPASTIETHSVYLAAGTLRYVGVSIATGQNGAFVVVDTTTSPFTVVQSGASGTGSYVNSGVIPAGVFGGKSFYKVWVSGSQTTSTSAPVIFGSNSPTGNAPLGPGYAGTGQTIIGWGDQFEPGSFPSSYIPTTTGTVTRAADVPTPTGALASCLAGAAGSLIIKTNSGQASIAATLMSANGSIMLGETAGNAATTNIGSSLTSSNTATWTSANDTGLSWGVGRGTIGLNNVFTRDGVTRRPASPFTLGSLSGSSAFLDGHVSSLSCFTQSLVSPQ